MNAIAKMYMEQERTKAAECRAKASATSLDMAKATYLELAEMHDRNAFTWELVGMNNAK
ncbi:hypothetical protein PHYNN_208 [Pantoea phage Phynn]|nr:hypothetical protein PHYNN_208 [Pantoea phage Phynn]